MVLNIGYQNFIDRMYTCNLHGKATFGSYRIGFKLIPFGIGLFRKHLKVKIF